ncbi:MAG: glycosyltransferase N-terminal domain-containing protein [Candidatus Cloacimonadota bacterium]|nr:glycosyltransferase N-terminal domain-containing protein [Candidatus Cloacimonadota bacterium]
MIFLYNILLTIAFPFVYLFMKIKLDKSEIKNRMRINFYGKNTIWIHAASVGEVNAATPLIKNLLSQFENILVTTITTTGKKTAESISNEISVNLLPLDYFSIMQNTFKRINPKIVILIETEFWPNLLYRANINNIPIVIVNGRISENSYPLYKKSKFFWKTPWKAIRAVGAQSEIDANRFRNLNFANVNNTHNLKFCLKLNNFESSEIRKKYNVSKDDFIVVFGSSRPGEEKFLLDSLDKIMIDNLKLFIAPRHLKRIPEIQKIFSEKDAKLLSENKSAKIIIIDKMGILNQFYSICDIAIVGGSFFDFGGHNPLEPAYYAKPIIMGKHFSSCKSSVTELKKRNAIQISENLHDSINYIYSNHNNAIEMGKNAKLTLLDNDSSIMMNMQLIKDILEETVEKK